MRRQAELNLLERARARRRDQQVVDLDDNDDGHTKKLSDEGRLSMLHRPEPELVQRTREVFIPHARRLLQPVE